MDRLEIIQQFIDQKKAKTYLEIGVFKGTVFHNVRAKRKLAVDPKFQFGKKEKFRGILKNFSNLHNEYYEMTSDDFFKRMADKKLKNGVDVVFIDGLHTYKQALKDIENCLPYLNKDGVIVVHDCNPTHEAAAYPAESLDHAKSLNLPGWRGEWCGDVYKTIAHLRSQRSDLDILVVDCDYGVGIVKKKAPSLKLDLSLEEIENIDYEKFNKSREEILNLKNVDYFLKECV